MENLRSFLLGVLVAPLALTGLAVVFAGSVSVPNQFTPGARAFASEINDNFDALQAAINHNDARLRAIEQRPLVQVGGSSQLIGSGSTQALLWQDVDGADPFTDDPLDMHSSMTDPELLVVPRRGYYLLFARVHWAANTVGRREVRYSVAISNGSFGGRLANAEAGTSTQGLTRSGGQILEFEVGDRVSVTVRHDVGAVVFCTPSSMQLTYLRPLP